MRLCRPDQGFPNQGMLGKRWLRHHMLKLHALSIMLHIHGLFEAAFVFRASCNPKCQNKQLKNTLAILTLRLKTAEKRTLYNMVVEPKSLFRAFGLRVILV